MAVPIALWLTGTSGDYASVPDHANLDIVGDITIEAEVGIAVMPPAAGIAFVSKWTTTGNQRSYWFGAIDDGTGKTVLQFKWSEDGIAVKTAKHDTALPVPSNTSRRIRYQVALDVNDGAGGHTVTFSYYDPVDSTLTQLGSVMQDPGGAGTTSIFASTAPVNVGGSDGGTADLWAGQVAFALISDGTTQLSADFSAEAAETTSFTEDSANAFTVTVNQAGAAPNTAEIREVTKFFTWRVPTQGSSTDIWGEPLNEAYGDDSTVIDSIDSVIKAVSDDVDALEAGVAVLDDRIGAAETLFNLPRYARVYRAATSFPFGTKGGAATLIQWDTAELDKDDWFSLASPTRLTKEATIDPPADGLHLVRVVLKLPSTIGDDDSYSYTVRLLKNGAAFAQTSSPTLNDGFASNSGFTHMRLEALTNLSPNDYIEVDVAWNADSGKSTQPSVQAGSQESWFEVVRVPSNSTPGIPAGLLSGILWWYEARLDNIITGIADEVDIATLDDWTSNERDAPATDTGLADMETDTTGLNGQPAYEAVAADLGVYQQTSPADPDFMSVLVIILPSHASTSQRFWFDTGQGGNTWYRMRNDGAGPDAAEAQLTIRAGGVFDTLNAAGSNIFDGNWHAVLCTYDGTTMSIYVDNMATVVSSKAHTVGGAISSGKDRVDIMHTNLASFFEGHWALHTGWDHALDSTERSTLAAFLLSEYGIS